MGDLRANRYGPEGQLVPGQQVAREAQQQRQHKQRHAHHPVKLSGRLVGGGVERPGHVQDDTQHHGVGRPAVDVAHEASRGNDVVDFLHRVVRLFGRRFVINHQRDPGDDQQKKQHQRDDAQPQRGVHAQRVAMDSRRQKVQEDVGEDGLRRCAVGRGPAVPHERIAKLPRRRQQVPPQLLQRACRLGRRVGRSVVGLRLWLLFRGLSCHHVFRPRGTTNAEESSIAQAKPSNARRDSRPCCDPRPVVHPARSTGRDATGPWGRDP